MNNDQLLKEFRTKFCVEDNLVLNTGSWSWSVRPAQATLGAGVISLNRYALHLSEVTPDEMKELAILIKTLESTIKSVFNHDIMNYLMLMMVDHHVHYHVIPRYNGERSFAGLEWVDNGWPALPVMGDNQHKDQSDVIKEIQRVLVQNIK